MMLPLAKRVLALDSGMRLRRVKTLSFRHHGDDVVPIPCQTIGNVLGMSGFHDLARGSGPVHDGPEVRPVTPLEGTGCEGSVVHADARRMLPMQRSDQAAGAERIVERKTPLPSGAQDDDRFVAGLQIPRFRSRAAAVMFK
jgi:hypothetical protein